MVILAGKLIICVNAKHLGQFSKYNIATGNLKIVLDNLIFNF